MADKRINALTTTSASVGDDYFAIDGATNGTRALSAFSPTFGGNATVTGTLTANSAITGPTLAPGLNTAAHYFTAYGATTSWPLRLSTIYDSNYVDQYLTLNGTLTGSRATPTFTGAAVGGSFIRSNGENSVLSVGTFVSGAGAAINTVAVFNPTNVTIPQTTASTTTSSGALVVGNGTSGGLGVGGNVTVGGQVDINAGTAAAPSLKLNGTNNGIYYTGSNIVRIAANATEAATFSATAATVAGTFTANTSVSSPQLVISSDSLGLSGGAGFYKKEADTVALGVMTSNTLRAWIRTTDARWFYQSGTPVTIQDTTASTATNIGALVVSGGVGVGGRVTTVGLQLGNNSQSIPAWGDTGAQLSVAGSIITDTTSSGTVARAVVNSIAGTALAASSPTTYTQAASLFIAAGPTANTNVTITNSYALFIAGGRINFGGLPTSSAGLQAGTLWNDGGTLKVA